MIRRRLAAASAVFVLAIVLATLPAPAGDAEPRPLLRFPDIHDDTVVFVHTGGTPGLFAYNTELGLQG